MAPITSSDSRGISVLALIVLFTLVASLAVWGRFWSRSAKKVSPAANDYVIFIALVRTPVALICSDLAHRRLQSDLHMGYRYLKHRGLHLGCVRSAHAICDSRGADCRCKSTSDQGIPRKADIVHWELFAKYRYP